MLRCWTCSTSVSTEHRNAKLLILLHRIDFVRHDGMLFLKLLTSVLHISARSYRVVVGQRHYFRRHELVKEMSSLRRGSNSLCINGVFCTAILLLCRLCEPLELISIYEHCALWFDTSSLGSLLLARARSYRAGEVA